MDGSKYLCSLQVSHTLLSLMDSSTGQPFSETRKRLEIFSRMLRSGVPQSFSRMETSQLFRQLTHVPGKDVKDAAGNFSLHINHPGL